MRMVWTAVLLLPFVAAQTATNDSVLWGAYRPNLYFGIRPRIPNSLMTGLMWFGNQDYQSISHTRHSCEQGDNLDSYGWTVYDPHQGGVQIIKDSENNVELTTEFLKTPGGDHGGSWAARIKGKPIRKDVLSRSNVIFYFGIEGLGSLEMDSDENENGLKGPIKFSGSSMELDDFTIRIVDDPKNVAKTDGPHSDTYKARLGRTSFMGKPIPEGTLWKAKEIILNTIVSRAQEILAPFKDPNALPPDPAFVLSLPNEIYTGSKLFAVQKSFEGEFQFDIFFESASAKHKLDSGSLDQGIPALVNSFNQNFDKTFPYPSDFPAESKQALQDFSKSITSSLAGGVGYFYGTSMINRKFSYEWDQDENTDSEQQHEGARLTEPKALLTATPSRSFFPRGFYWDEGFHLLHLGLLDSDFTVEILKDWVSLIDEDGWVAREQILGEEARSKVPAEFQTQVPNYANPPTLTMALAAAMSRIKKNSHEPSAQVLGMDMGFGDGQVPLQAVNRSSETVALADNHNAAEFFKASYKPLKRHYDWFRRTQRGQIKQYSRQARSRSEAYRWRGRSESHVLTSGMDDYPRGPPHAGELHLDLISWMAFFSRTMRDIATFVGETDDAVTYTEIEKAILNNIEDLHWSEKDQMYCDLNVDAEDESYSVCHKGYLSLFPLLLSLLPADSPHLGPILDLLHDPKHLWSPYGLRSLSASHPEFGKGENYWKGPIWIQMNYLALSALHNTYAAQEGPHQQRAKEIYTQLRQNVVNNVFKEYEKTGYTWEQYDSETGKGQRSRPFTGWTSLVTLILSEQYF